MPDSVRIAQIFLESLYAGELARAADTLDPEMRATIDDGALAKMLESLQRMYGKPVRHSGTRTSKTMGNADIVYLFWDFERQRVDARMIMSPANRIVALSFETPVIK